MNTQSENTLRLVKKVQSAKARILFLGYDEDQTPIVEALISKNCEVWHTQEKVTTTQGYDLVVSFGYRHILKKAVLESSTAPVINLHISYLPWNRGAHPNFWSFYDGTPSGVTIHLIDEGIDTGPILYQRYVNFQKEEVTFSHTYRRLISEVEDLFVSNIDDIITKKFQPIPQRRQGSHHRLSDLPKEFAGWDSEIQAEICRLDKLLTRPKVI